MRRHGWTLGLGLLFGTAAAAQPPADLERYPPAPDLPGQVVSQGGRPVASAGKLPIKQTGMKTAEPVAPAPPMTNGPPPAYPTVATATIATVVPETPPSETLPAPVAARPTKAGKAGKLEDCDNCVSRFFDWICFRSRSKQSGHFPSPYCPPLQAWFPCENKCSSCSSQRYGPVVVPGPVTVVPTVPAAKAATETPAKPSTPPSTSAPLPPGTVVATGPDVLPGFRQVDMGLSFPPGAAPISRPTSQVERVSNWRPK